MYSTLFYMCPPPVSSLSLCCFCMFVFPYSLIVLIQPCTTVDNGGRGGGGAGEEEEGEELKHQC